MDDILNKWSTMPENQRGGYRSLLEEMVALAKKYKADASEAESAVFRSRYVMD